MMGGLHIEMAIENMIGKWLSGSGWTDIVAKAEVFSSGRADALLKACHVKRTRYAHEVSIASLYILRADAYSQEISDTSTVLSVMDS